MKALFFTVCLLFFSFNLLAQSRNQKSVVDNQKKFFYSDTGGVTRSYIEHFGDQFHVTELKTIDGKIYTAESLRGKTVVYNFWFVACKPCVAEMPALNRLANKHKSDSVLFIGITFDNEARIREFLQKNKFDFQIASLPQTEIEKIKKFSFFPFTTIVTKEGKLSFAFFGKPAGKDPEARLVELLSSQIEKAIHFP